MLTGGTVDSLRDWWRYLSALRTARSRMLVRHLRSVTAILIDLFTTVTRQYMFDPTEMMELLLINRQCPLLILRGGHKGKRRFVTMCETEPHRTTRGFWFHLFDHVRYGRGKSARASSREIGISFGDESKEDPPRFLITQARSDQYAILLLGQPQVYKSRSGSLQ